jgi:4-amino-4-deoxychorismate lyase
LLIDGRRAGTLDASDRGLQYGDGLFETLAVVNGRAALWDEHMRRLQQGCARLGIPAPATATLHDEAGELCSELERGVLKIIVTRGSGGRGYRPPDAPVPRRLISVHPYPDYPHRFWYEGVAVRICRTRLGVQPALAGLKHLNRLEQVMARAEWTDPEIAEALMLSHNDRLIEGTVSNVFAVVDGELWTPALDDAGVEGVMRAHVLDLANKMDVTVRETMMDMATLDAASEVFLTNSVIGLWPVRAVGDRALTPGPYAAELLSRLVDEQVIPVPEQGGAE